uniref:NBS-LRR type R protein Nbs9-75 n=1 Tax=Oryza sativa subsp. japonica TaxID=39947 RepID=Q0ZHC6_ORYSJ|nr:NBS-LRR type R protein Nbs9-75 [Oryza sativa Japonica Group]
MADTVLSIAKSLVGSAVSKVASVAADKMVLLLGVQKEIWFIKDELQTIQAFLMAAEPSKKSILLKVWVQQVRDLSYDIEDCLDEFTVHVSSQTLSRQLMKLKDRHRIAIQIRNLRTRIEEVSTRNIRYNLIENDLTCTTTDERNLFMEDIRNQSANNIEEADLVGFSGPKRELLDLIDVHANDGPTKVVCVVGMGGLGKTTIARKIYESKEDIAKNFSCCAWITVSQSFVRVELLKDLMVKLFGEEVLKKRLRELEGKVPQVDDLASYLRTELNERRYFVVLDDVWSTDSWKWINSIAFPRNNNKGSRVIVTTRDVGLAKECTSELLIYQLKPLEISYAKELLLRKANKTTEDMESDKKMSDIITKIVKKCGYLPLAILTIGGVLATKEIREWETFYSQIPSELESNPNLEAMRRIVTLSYNYLPSHLKQCFLYLSIFPEDFEINRNRLVNRWMAEGFIKARVNMTIEDVGKSYFKELINRSMIQPSRAGIRGEFQSCRVHDIMRDITISISREENFVFLPRGTDYEAVQGNTRHIAFQESKYCSKISFDWSIIRSLTMFAERPVELEHSVCSSQLRMLRVLDLTDAQFTITQNDVNNIVLLCHLKYLRIARYNNASYIYSLPKSIGRLDGLQTLDLDSTNISTLPTQITKLRSLRSLRCMKQYDFSSLTTCLTNTFCLPMIFTPSVSTSDRAEKIANLHLATKSFRSKSNGVKVPKGICRLRDLQILGVVDIRRTSSRVIKELGQLSKLRKLYVVTKGSTKLKCEILYTAIQKLYSLQSLHMDAVGCTGIGTLECLDSVSSPPPLLRTLKLNGSLEELPNWIERLTHLRKFYLLRTKLKEGKTMLILGALPNLMLLHFCHNAYLGEKLVFKTGAFPNLRTLVTFNLDQQRDIRFEDGSSPQLEKIEIGRCRLESGIIGIIHLPRLKEISVQYKGKVAMLAQLEGEVNAHPNRPVLRMAMDRSDHDLAGDAKGSPP